MYPHKECDRIFARDSRVRRALRALSVAGGVILPLLMTHANAGAWIPAAGHGEVTSELRYSFADRSFPTGSFSSRTHPSTRGHKTQIRLTGEHGLGNGFSLDYDLRYGFLSQLKTKKGVTTAYDNDGFQDQRVGINYGMRQESAFADAIGLGVVAPGSSGAGQPALDSGQWALEPIYRLGFKPGIAGLTANVDFATRTFLDGGVMQFRTHVELMAPITRRIHLVGKVFFVRSARMRRYDDGRDRGELCDLLRLGIGIQYRLTKKVESVLAYDSDIAGMSRHADHRFTAGVKFKY